MVSVHRFSVAANTIRDSRYKTQGPDLTFSASKKLSKQYRGDTAGRQKTLFIPLHLPAAGFTYMERGNGASDGETMNNNTDPEYLLVTVSNLGVARTSPVEFLRIEWLDNPAMLAAIDTAIATGRAEVTVRGWGPLVLSRIEENAAD